MFIERPLTVLHKNNNFFFSRYKKAIVDQFVVWWRQTIRCCCTACNGWVFPTKCVCIKCLLISFLTNLLRDNDNSANNSKMGKIKDEWRAQKYRKTFLYTRNSLCNVWKQHVCWMHCKMNAECKQKEKNLQLNMRKTFSHLCSFLSGDFSSTWQTRFIRFKHRTKMAKRVFWIACRH